MKRGFFVVVGLVLGVDWIPEVREREGKREKGGGGGGGGGNKKEGLREYVQVKSSSSALPVFKLIISLPKLIAMTR